MLTEEGFIVDVATDGDQGLHLAKSISFDLIILDVMLPGRDGWQVVTELRRTGQQTPILFLTARDAIPDRVKGFELGADDYLVKPFAFSELLARVRSLLRRAPARQLEIVRVADLEVDLFYVIEQCVVVSGLTWLRKSFSCFLYSPNGPERSSRECLSLKPFGI